MCKLGLLQDSGFCQLNAIISNLSFEESLFKTATQRQKYEIFDCTEPILERHLHLTRIQKNSLVIVFMDNVHLDKIGHP